MWCFVVAVEGSIGGWKVVEVLATGNIQEGSEVDEPGHPASPGPNRDRKIL